MEARVRWLLTSEIFSLIHFLTSHPSLVAKLPPEILTTLKEIYVSLTSDPEPLHEILFVESLAEILKCGEANASLIAHTLAAVERLHPIVDMSSLKSALIECKFNGTEKADELVLIRLLHLIQLVAIQHEFDLKAFELAIKIYKSEVYGEALRLTAKNFICDIVKFAPVDDSLVTKAISNELLNCDQENSEYVTFLLMLSESRLHSEVQLIQVSFILKAAFKYTLTVTSNTIPAVNVLITAFSTERVLKSFSSQFEWLINVLLDLAKGTSLSSDSPKSTSTISREYVIESIALLTYIVPNLMTILYVAYQCCAGYGTILSDLLETLTTCIRFQKDGKHKERGMRAAQVMVNLLDTMYAPNHPLTEEMKLALDTQLQRKSLFEQAAQEFNSNPREGILFAINHGLCKSTDPKDVAHYLHNSPNLDKKVIGEYLVKEANVLSAFMNDFKFDPDTRIDQAVRVVLESFRLPGEAQQIDRVMETLASVYYNTAASHSSSNPFASQDAAFVLSYSIIMLNTDQHNPQVRNRMTLEQFIRNNRGINDGCDFDDSYLKTIYEAIKTEPIILPSEQYGQNILDFKWNAVCQRTSPFLNEEKIEIIDAYGPIVMSQLVFKPVMEAFASLLHYSNQRHVTEGQFRVALKGYASLAMTLHRLGLLKEWEQLMEVGFEFSGYAAYYVAKSGNSLPKYIARSSTLQQTLTILLSILSDCNASCNAFFDFISALVDSSLLSIEDIVPVEESIENGIKIRSESISKLVETPKPESGLFSSFISSYWRGSSTGSNTIGLLPSLSTPSSSTPTPTLSEPPEGIQPSKEFVHSKLVPLLKNILHSVTHVYSTDKTSFVRFALELQYWQAMHSNDPPLDFPQILSQILSNSSHFGALDKTNNLLRLALIAMLRIAIKNPQLLPKALQLLTMQPNFVLKCVIEGTAGMLAEYLANMHPESIGSELWPSLFAFFTLFESQKLDPVLLSCLLQSLLRKDTIIVPEIFFVQYTDLWAKQLPLMGDQVIDAWISMDSIIRTQTNLVNSQANYSLPLHCSIAQCCAFPDRQSRQNAFACLQRILTGISIEYEEIEYVLLPLLDELLMVCKSADWPTEIIQRLVALIGRLTLQNLSTDSGSIWYPFNEQFYQSYWTSLIASFSHASSSLALVKDSIARDAVIEAIREVLRNMLLVIRTQYFQKDDAFWKQYFVEPILNSGIKIKGLDLDADPNNDVDGGHKHVPEKTSPSQQVLQLDSTSDQSDIIVEIKKEPENHNQQNMLDKTTLMTRVELPDTPQSKVTPTFYV